ncbi:MAG: hypothetical protein ACREN1_10390 [Candidatus Dormibacteria bacterium]
MERSGDTGRATWISSSLAQGRSGTAGSLVPGGFAAYARILHPAFGRGGDGERPVRWREVAHWSGERLSRRVQFNQIALPRVAKDDPPPWERGPVHGSLELEDCRRLIEILEVACGPAGRCWFCLWDGYGWEDGGGLATGAVGGLEAVPPEVRQGAKVTMPGRSYLLYSGGLRDALAFTGASGQTPNLWWPADRIWCVASEIDLTWTYVGGPTKLVQTLLQDSRLEALPVEVDDSCLFELSPAYHRLVLAACAALLDHGAAAIPTPLGDIEASLTGAGRWAQLQTRWKRRHPQREHAAWSLVDASHSGSIQSLLAQAVGALAAG